MKLSKRIRKNNLAGKNVLNKVWAVYIKTKQKVSFEKYLSQCLFVQSDKLKLGKNLI